jgi:hypothetical protein
MVKWVDQIKPLIKMYFKTISSVRGPARVSQTFLRNSILFLSAIAAFILLVAVCILVSLKMNNATFIYPLDDTYIHMTIARNLALHGNWGMNPEVFASASSSILYTLLLASAFLIGGVNELVPLGLNLSAALLVIWYFYRIAQLRGVTPRYFAFILVLLLGGVSMIPLSISGMEHTWQILIGVLFLYESARYIDSANRRLSWSLLFFAALATMIRYESIFLVGIVAFFMCVRRQRLQAALLIVAGFLPILLFGMYSLSQGGYFLPNSLLLKGHTPVMSPGGLFLFGVGWMIKLVHEPHLLMLFIVLCFLSVVSFLRPGDKWKLENIVIWILVLLFIAHLTFAQTGWFYRYEAYLLAFSFFAFMLLEKQIGPILKVWSARYLSMRLKTVLLILAIPLLVRGLYTMRNTPFAMNNIYSQQYQMASFVHKFHPSVRVVANDIGAISYYNDLYLLDLFGLASRQVLDLKRSGNFNKSEIAALASGEKMRLALVYDYPEIIPDTWIKIGEWTIKHNVVCANSTVAAYLVDDRKDSRRIIDAFNAYARTLPEGVRYKCYLK